MTISSLKLTAALAGAVALAGASLPTTVVAQDTEKCYGVADTGENDCANAAGTHSCAGQSTEPFDGGEWKYVTAGTCEDMGGQLEPFEGVNPNPPA